MKLFSKDGIEMMEVKSIDQVGERLVLKGKMMGAMATTIYVTPLDMWKAYRLFPPRVMAGLPRLLFKGWRQSRKTGPSK